MTPTTSTSFHNIHPEVMRSESYIPTTDVVEIATCALLELKTFSHFRRGCPSSTRALEWVSKMHIILSTQAFLSSGMYTAVRLRNLKMIQAKVLEIFPHLDFSVEYIETAIKDSETSFGKIQKVLEMPDLSEAPNNALLGFSRQIADVAGKIFEVYQELRGRLLSLSESPFIVHAFPEPHEYINGVVREKLQVSRQNVMNLIEEMREKLDLYVEIQSGIHFFTSEVSELPSRCYDKDLFRDKIDARLIQYRLNDGSYFDQSSDDLEKTIEIVQDLVKRFKPE